jgi:sigma-B regulation protein RsbU (phosphoserine phosphatase)
MPIDLEAVIAPFRELAGVEIAIEGPAGVVLAGTSNERPPADAVTHSIEVGPLAGSRISVWGVRAEEGLTHAFLAALVAVLGGGGYADPLTAPRDGAGARRIDEELAHGRRLQRSFVSLVAPDVPGYEVASHYEAAREVGGDFFDLFRLRRRGRPLSVVIADVTGKGIAAALLMAFSRPLLHAAIDHTTGPAAALERTNRILVEERRSSLFITALCARLDLPSGHLAVANAGHEPPLVVRADGSPIECLAEAGPLIGAFPKIEIPEVATDLAPGDVVLFYTDGVTDARDPAGDRFEEMRLFAAVESARGGTAQDVVDAVAAAMERFEGPTEPADDVTIVAIRRVPAPDAPEPRS